MTRQTDAARILLSLKKPVFPVPPAALAKALGQEHALPSRRETAGVVGRFNAVLGIVTAAYGKKDAAQLTLELLCPLPVLRMAGVDSPTEIKQLCAVPIAQARQVYLALRQQTPVPLTAQERVLIEAFLPSVWRHSAKKIRALKKRSERLLSLNNL